MTPSETTNAPRTARAAARELLTSQILETARSHLVERGAGELSLRAVARELGMASSAVYRYFPSRDALLTALIIDAYDALGQTAEEADAAVDRDDHLGRWRAIAHAVRGWALAHPHEYALIYGTPVPGYEAPEDTQQSSGLLSWLKNFQELLSHTAPLL
ncbi:MAG: TetR/AcrR family transcriptional regulator, partial [Actinomycetota bacterium]